MFKFPWLVDYLLSSHPYVVCGVPRCVRFVDKLDVNKLISEDALVNVADTCTSVKTAFKMSSAQLARANLQNLEINKNLIFLKRYYFMYARSINSKSVSTNEILLVVLDFNIRPVEVISQWNSNTFTNCMNIDNLIHKMNDQIKGNPTMLFQHVNKNAYPSLKDIEIVDRSSFIKKRFFEKINMSSHDNNKWWSFRSSLCSSSNGSMLDILHEDVDWSGLSHVHTIRRKLEVESGNQNWVEPGMEKPVFQEEFTGLSPMKRLTFIKSKKNFGCQTKYKRMPERLLKKIGHEFLVLKGICENEEKLLAKLNKKQGKKYKMPRGNEHLPSYSERLHSMSYEFSVHKDAEHELLPSPIVSDSQGHLGIVLNIPTEKYQELCRNKDEQMSIENITGDYEGPMINKSKGLEEAAKEFNFTSLVDKNNSETFRQIHTSHQIVDKTQAMKGILNNPEIIDHKMLDNLSDPQISNSNKSTCHNIINSVTANRKVYFDDETSDAPTTNSVAKRNNVETCSLDIAFSNCAKKPRLDIKQIEDGLLTRPGICLNDKQLHSSCNSSADVPTLQHPSSLVMSTVRESSKPSDQIDEIQEEGQDIYSLPGWNKLLPKLNQHLAIKKFNDNFVECDLKQMFQPMVYYHNTKESTTSKDQTASKGIRVKSQKSKVSQEFLRCHMTASNSNKNSIFKKRAIQSSTMSVASNLAYNSHLLIPTPKNSFPPYQHPLKHDCTTGPSLLRQHHKNFDLLAQSDVIDDFFAQRERLNKFEIPDSFKELSYLSFRTKLM